MAGLDDIAPGKGKRGLIVGGTRSGKSTLLDWFMRYFVKSRPHIQIVLLDSKPRFRAEIERYGIQNRFSRSAERHYRDWEKGPLVPRSIRVDIHRENPLERLWRDDDNYRIAIAQTELATERPKLLEIADDWYQIRKRHADRVLVVDELLDYYHRNSLSIHAARDVPLKVVRAGGERGFGGLYGAQRPKRTPTANLRGTLRPVPVSPALCRRYPVSLGYGYAPGHHPARRGRRRLCVPSHQNQARRQSGIQQYLPFEVVSGVSVPAFRNVGGM